jgi:hypothetical protein
LLELTLAYTPVQPIKGHEMERTKPPALWNLESETQLVHAAVCHPSLSNDQWRETRGVLCSPLRGCDVLQTLTVVTLARSLAEKATRRRPRSPLSPSVVTREICAMSEAWNRGDRDASARTPLHGGEHAGPANDRGEQQTRHILLGVSHASDDPARSDPERGGADEDARRGGLDRGHGGADRCDA